MDVDRLRAIMEKISEELSRMSGRKYTADLVTEYPSRKRYLRCADLSRMYPSEYKESAIEYPVKSQDGRELGQIYTDIDLRIVYFWGERRIEWPDDWIDPYPEFINKVELTDDYIKVRMSGDVELNFMCLAYYAVEIFQPSYECLINREDRTKLARFIPAVIKDFNVLLRFLDEACSKYGIEKSEVKLNPSSFNCSLRFSIAGMKDREVFKKTLLRIKALTEVKRRFGEWLPSEERKKYYEDTMIFPEDPFRKKFRREENEYEGSRYICKWPYESGDPETDKEYERSLKHALWNSLLEKYYDLKGHRLRLARRVGEKIEFIGSANENEWIKIDRNEIRKEDLDSEDIVVAIDRRMKKLPKIPLGKIEFLKEDFPELWKQ